METGWLEIPPAQDQPRTDEKEEAQCGPIFWSLKKSQNSKIFCEAPSPANVRCWQLTQKKKNIVARQNTSVDQIQSVGHHFEISDLKEWMAAFLVILWFPVGEGLG